MTDARREGVQCDYCHAVGACPKCWGRAAIDELTQRLAAVEGELANAKAVASTLYDGGRKLKAEKAAAEKLCDDYKTDLQRVRGTLVQILVKEYRVTRSTDREFVCDMCGDEWEHPHMDCHVGHLLALTGHATGGKGMSEMSRRQRLKEFAEIVERDKLAREELTVCFHPSYPDPVYKDRATLLGVVEAYERRIKKLSELAVVMDQSTFGLATKKILEQWWHEDGCPIPEVRRE